MNRNNPLLHRVTLVDDESSVLEVLTRAAQTWNYDCQAARSAEEALELMERQWTPIVVTDIHMPGRGGMWLVNEIQRRWPEVGIIVITGEHEENIVDECLHAGAHHFFLKPINLDEFHHALESTARNYRLRENNDRYRNYLEETIHRKTTQIRRTFLAAIDSLVRLLEARDSYTSGHSLRVSQYAVALARDCGLDRIQCKQIRLAAKLHDIGKIGVPDAILNKPAKLSEVEMAFVRKHPAIGERILKSTIRNRNVLAGIRSHHEHFDGEGYPDGLQGEAIPFIARLIAVVDCFDALTSSRAYRKPMTVAQALEILRDGRGTQFDPHLAARFLDLVQSGRFAASLHDNLPASSANSRGASPPREPGTKKS